MPGLTDIINDLPPELAAGDDDTDTSAENDSQVGADDDADNTEDDTNPEDNNDDDYITDPEEDEPVAPAADIPPAPPVVNDEGTFILQNLAKIQVRIVAADDSVKTVEVYGWGDLPRDYKGFPTKYEEGIFQQAANAQELKARDLQTQYHNNKMQADTEQYVQRENKAIAEDLTELRQEGLFPKFKGTPGTKEFNDSAGAKEFDKVIAYMNEQNDRYGKAAQTGKAYRHIGFREAFTMLNGPNPKAADKAEDKARRGAAGKLKSSRGTPADTTQVSTKRVTNITELGDEFAQFVGSGAGAAK